MSTTVAELMQSRRSRGGAANSRELVYLISGTPSDSAAMAALLAASPATYDGLPRNDYTVEPQFVDAITNAGRWIGTVTYSDPKRTLIVGTVSFNFQTSTGQTHITQSLETIASYATAGTASDFKGAIGVTEDLDVEGVDIDVQEVSFSITKTLAAMPSPYTLAQLTAYNISQPVNASTWTLAHDDQELSFAAGEVRLVSFAASKPANDKWQLTFNFSAIPNLSGATIGAITGVAKKGHHYLWTRYQTTTDSTSGRAVKRPVEAFVERVYGEGNAAFSLIESILAL